MKGLSSRTTAISSASAHFWSACCVTGGTGSRRMRKGGREEEGEELATLARPLPPSKLVSSLIYLLPNCTNKTCIWDVYML